jgi:hypothetical protein
MADKRGACAVSECFIKKDGGDDHMKSLLKRIYMYFKDREIWDTKMSEHLQIRIISTPQDKNVGKAK